MSTEAAIKAPKLRAFDIQCALWRDLSQASMLVMPNYTPASWWECDMMSVTKAGYWSEYEIKLSVADFKADAKKNRREGFRYCKIAKKVVEVPGLSKHAELALGSEKGPSFFWYVIPKELKEKVTVPEWAGLKLAVSIPARPGSGLHAGSPARVSLYTEKPAPRLHKAKLPDSILSHARGVCYWRFWNLKTDIAKAVRRELGRAAA